MACGQDDSAGCCSRAAASSPTAKDERAVEGVVWSDSLAVTRRRANQTGAQRYVRLPARNVTMVTRTETKR